MTSDGIGTANAGTRSTGRDASAMRSSLLGDDLVDAGLQPRQPPHGEFRGEEPAEPGAVGRVGEA